MKLQISNCKKAAVQDGMIGLFLRISTTRRTAVCTQRLIENRSFSFVDCYGDVGDYYTKPAWGYGWNATKECGEGRMEYVTGSPISRVNPWYLRFTAQDAGQGFWNKAYDGIYLEKGKTYTVRFMRGRRSIGREYYGTGHKGRQNLRAGRGFLHPCAGENLAEMEPV